VSEQNIVHYAVELQVAASVWKGAPPFINVEVKCPTTGQVHMVPVRIQRGDQSGILPTVITARSELRKVLFLVLSVCGFLFVYEISWGNR